MMIALRSGNETEGEGEEGGRAGRRQVTVELWCCLPVPASLSLLVHLSLPPPPRLTGSPPPTTPPPPHLPQPPPPPLPHGRSQACFQVGLGGV